MTLTEQEVPEPLRRRHADILDGKETYGEGDAQAQALRYWLEHLAEPIIEQAGAKLRKAGRLPKVDLLVSVAGFSPETTIVTAGVFQPREVLVITSGRPYDNIDIIGDFLLKRGLRPRQFHHERCAAADLSIFQVICRRVKVADSLTLRCSIRLSIFQVICRRVKEHREARADSGQSDTDGETLVDITGGKKVMSAGAAVAAWELDLRISYVNPTYDPVRRTAVPGTEEIVLLDSPYALYGGGEMNRADHDFDLGAFEVARSRYEKLAERLAEPARVRFLREVAGFYEAWRNLDIEGLKEFIPRVRAKLDEPSPLSRAHGAQLDAQLRFVDRLVAGDRPARVMTLFLLGDANMHMARYDFSALLFYRTIEASIASRIEQRFSGFQCDEPDYTKIDENVEDLRARFRATARQVMPNEEDNFDLPRKVACFDGALLLRVVNDDLLERAHVVDTSALGQIRNLAATRNHSILAHGYQSVTEKNCKDLRSPAERLLSAYWTLNNEAVPFAQAIEALRFLRLQPK